MSVVSPNARPVRVSGLLATLFGLAAVGVLADGTVRSSLAVEAVGLGILAGGLALVRRERRLLGAAVAGVGVAAVLASIGLVWARTADLFAALQFFPGMIGAFVVALGVIPVRGGGSRSLVKAGTGILFLTVLTAGVIQRPGLTTLLASGVATVLAWDAGENAIGIGAQLGRRAETWWIELSHVAATAAVGLVAIVAARVVDGFGTPGLPTTEFAVLIIGLVSLAVALHD